MQQEAEEDNKIRAKLFNTYKWSIDDFLYFEMQVPGQYSYIDKYYDDDTENIGKLFEAIVAWMKQGWLPRHIEPHTLKFYYAFGRDGFFKQDIEAICNWCGSMRILDYKIRHNDDVFLLKSQAKGIEDPVQAMEIIEKW